MLCFLFQHGANIKGGVVHIKVKESKYFLRKVSDAFPVTCCLLREY
jgi:hypothetical protein